MHMSNRRRQEDRSSLEVLRHWREAVPNDRLAHLIKDAMRGVSRALQFRLARRSVSFGHWTFLRILWEKDGITQRELSGLAGVMEPTTFGALKTMGALGFITRRKMPHNKKNVYIDLTPEGRALKELLVPLAEEVNQVAVRGIPARDIAVTRRTLLAIIENLAHDEGRLMEHEQEQDTKPAPAAAEKEPAPRRRQA
jgi:DNA-binding MarR family transcriptional regulator